MLRRTLLAAPFLASAAAAQPAWPARPIRIVNPFPAGSPDAMARFLAEPLGAALGQPVLVESRSGAGGTIGADFVAHAPADGHVLGISNAAPHAVAPAVYPALRYDPVRDFTHLALLGEFPLGLAVAAEAPYADLAGLLDAARAQPGSLRVGTPGNGTIPQLSLDVLRDATGASFAHVPFRGATVAVIETIAGRIEATVAGLGEVGSQDRLRLLAIAATSRLPRHPAVPTFREAGIDFVASAWFGLCAPAGLPAPVAARLERELRGITGGDGYARFVAGIGAAPLRDLDGAGMAAFVAAEGARWQPVARAAGIRAE
jgi:tripartite-type tricarboxylate transporter receptor subunit TctC